ncbi:SRPBCC domain-containing protein [Protaetiibacter mangrovi]|uniref:SRPBCC domain-containing protein n=1 Tax=Protaetiibacter mangrovi TaxID=2970926 RepID=A0ABT1ZG52_9MICO|nr:SRPBCC domain-containing protein [Protaetiibacter mangrovi]MCS0499688.1 SRPBCC domain-containing protein [Protaetiibacter mangrovi]TPX03751.1 hypothetical protein FJ656_15515 [Schumannella luteola]
MTDQRLIGELREEGGLGVVHVEDVYATGIDDLWSAITDPERLARWVVRIEGELRVGGEFTAAFTSGWRGMGVVEVCEAPHRLQVRTWEPGGVTTTIEALLTPEGAGTRLVIEDRGLPLEEYAAHGAGWQAHVEDLAAYLAGRVPRSWEERWHELSADYLELARAAR